MLQTLKNIAPQEAQEILVVISEEFLPRPFDEKPSYEIDPTVYSKALHEVRKRAYVKDGDNSEKAKTRILTLLSNEISQLILTPNRRKGALERIANKGMIPIRDYEIVFEKNFAQFEALGVTKSHVRNAAQHVDQYYHSESQYVRTTLFTSIVEKANPIDSFTMLCHASRVNTKLYIRSVFYLYKSELNITYSLSIIELFKAFLNKYGLIIEGVEPTDSNLIENKILPSVYAANSLESDIMKSISKKIEGRKEIYLHISNFIYPNGTVEWSNIYAVNFYPYRKDLLKHHVSVNEDFFENRLSLFHRSEFS